MNSGASSGVQAFPAFGSATYINASDVGGPGGLIFSATITTSAPVPEPAVLAPLGLGSPA